MPIGRHDMKTYPINDETGNPFAVEVDVAFCSIRNLAKTIGSVDGVTDVEVCKPFSGERDVRAKFRYQGDEFVVVEPFGDNSRYWIGPVSENSRRDLSSIEKQIRSYVPPFFRRIVGALVTLNFRAAAGR